MPRLEAKIDFTDGGRGCWLWTAAKNADGYGMFQYATGDTRRAHRVVYELLVGPIPEGYHLDHVKELCGNRHCVKAVAVEGTPAHLEPVLPGENIQRGATGRWQTERATHKTHCSQGHDLSVHGRWAERKNGKAQWVCRACYRAYRREWERRSK